MGRRSRAARPTTRARAAGCCSSARTRRRGPGELRDESWRGWRRSLPSEADARHAEDLGAARPDAGHRALPRAAPRDRRSRRRRALFDVPREQLRATSTCCSCPACRLRAGRPDRRRRRGGRPHLDQDGRPLLAAAAAVAERGARALPARHGAARARPACPRRRPRVGAGEARVGARPRDARRHRAASRRRTRGRRRSRSDRSARPPATAHRVRIEYFAHSSGEWSTRGIDPEEVFVALGHWYVAAWDVTPTASGSSAPIGSARSSRRANGSRRADSRGRAGRSTRRPRTTSPFGCGWRPPARWIAEYYATTDERRASRRLPRGHAPRRGRWDGSRGCCCGWERRERDRATGAGRAGARPGRGHARPIRGVTSPHWVAPFGGQRLKPGPLRR